MGAAESKNDTDKFTEDLTAIAASGVLMPVIGRDEETSRLIKTLCRKNKNNPCLIGDPGAPLHPVCRVI